jgi:hypothetical protein
VDELLTMVNVALGSADIAICAAGDGNSDGHITVDEILTAVNNALNGCPQTGTSMERGLLALSTGNLRSAEGEFCAAAATAASDDPANLYCAITRVVAALDDPRLVALAQQSGVTRIGDARDVCGWRLLLPSGTANAAQLFATLRDVLGPEIDAAASALKRMPNTVQILLHLAQLPYCMHGRNELRSIEIDRGDVLTFAGMLEALRGALDVATAYDFNANLTDLFYAPPQDLLAHTPALLSLVSDGSLGSARQSFDAALGDLNSAITAVLAETDDQSNDFFVIAPADNGSAVRTARVLDLVRQSLYGEVLLGSEVGMIPPARLNLSKSFAGQFASLRPLLPSFSSTGGFDRTQFPDPTFGGMAPDLTQHQIDAALPAIHDYLGRVGEKRCYHYAAAEDATACGAQQAEYRCSYSYFDSYFKSCQLYSCPCMF